MNNLQGDLAGHAHTVLDDGHAGLVPIRIDVSEDGDVQPRRFEITLVVQLELWFGGGNARQQSQARYRAGDQVFHGRSSQQPLMRPYSSDYKA